MRWLLSLEETAPVALSVDFDAFSPGGDEGRVTFVHWSDQADEVAGTLDAMLLSAPLVLPGRLWRRELGPPHDRSLERLKHILDEAFSTTEITQVPGPPPSGDAAQTWRLLAADVRRAMQSASAATSQKGPSMPTKRWTPQTIEEDLSVLRTAPEVTDDWGDEVHAHLSVIADRRRAPFRGLDDPATMQQRFAADALDRAAQRWLTARVRRARR